MVKLRPVPTRRKAAIPARRGRPHKAAVPAVASQPITTSAALTAQLDAVKVKAATGARLANHESRLLRDAWLLDMATHLWPNLEACAADLTVSPSTVRGYSDAGCPGLEPHSPIPKAPVLTWLLRSAHARGAAVPHANRESIEAVDLRIKSAKAAKLERSLVAEAEDRATQGVIAAMASLRQHLLHALPGIIYEACAAQPDRSDAEDAISRAIDHALALHGTTTPAPTTGTTP